MSDTATIRVPVRTRDWLAQLAADKDESLSMYVTKLAKRQRRAAILEAARNEAREFEENPEARAEFLLWDETFDDFD